MLDLTFVRMANEPRIEKQAKKRSEKLMELFGCFLTGIFICTFLIVIYYI